MNDLPVHIRTAGMDDLDAMVGVHTAARTSYFRDGGVPETVVNESIGLVGRFTGWARAIQLPGRTTLCAVRSKEVVGALSMGPAEDGTVFDLLQIHVRPGAWGQGVGSRLHAAYVEALCDSGAARGRLMVWEGNTRAQSFYGRRGWRADGTTATGEDGLRYLRLRLDVA